MMLDECKYDENVPVKDDVQLNYQTSSMTTNKLL